MSDILEKLKTERNMDDLTKVIFKTSMGNITIALYDNTPLHKENFLKLVKSDYYNDILFHRIIQGFMIQTGDPDSKGAPVGKQLGSGGPDYTIPAEFRKENYHKRCRLTIRKCIHPHLPRKVRQKTLHSPWILRKD